MVFTLTLRTAGVHAGLLPGLWPRLGWSTRRFPLWCSCPGSGSSGKWPPAPAVAGWWNESAAAAASSSWDPPRSRHRSCVQRSSPFLWIINQCEITVCYSDRVLLIAIGHLCIEEVYLFFYLLFTLTVKRFRQKLKAPQQTKLKSTLGQRERACQHDKNTNK